MFKVNITHQFLDLKVRVILYTLSSYVRNLTHKMCELTLRCVILHATCVFKQKLCRDKFKMCYYITVRCVNYHAIFSKSVFHISKDVSTDTLLLLNSLSILLSCKLLIVNSNMFWRRNNYKTNSYITHISLY